MIFFCLHSLHTFLRAVFCAIASVASIFFYLLLMDVFNKGVEGEKKKTKLSKEDEVYAHTHNVSSLAG